MMIINTLYSVKERVKICVKFCHYLFITNEHCLWDMLFFQLLHAKAKTDKKVVILANKLLGNIHKEKFNRGGNSQPKVD